MKAQQNTLNSEILFLCERVEHAQFLHAYLRHLFRQGLSLPPVQLITYDGVGRLEAVVQRLAGLKGSACVRKAVVFADGGTNLLMRSEMVNAVLSSRFFQRMEYAAPFFFPGVTVNGRWQRGYLEDVLLKCLRQQTAEHGDCRSLLNMSSEFLKCANSLRGAADKLQNSARHLLYAYFAATEDYAGLRFGEAAQKGAFDLDAESWSDLRAVLFALQDK